MSTSDDYVAYGNIEEKDVLKLGWLIAASPLTSALDFPPADREYHNYTGEEDLQKLATDYSQIVRLITIGKTVEVAI